MKRLRLEFFLLGLTFFSCAKLLVGDEEVENTPVNNFEIFWEEMDEHYSFFELKKIDWDSVYQLYRPRIESVTSNSELRQVFEELIVSLKDGHVSMYLNNDMITYDYKEGFPGNSNEFVINYLENISGNRTKLVSADVIATNLGYLLVTSFGGEREEFDRIDDIMERFSSKDGVIIDLRQNGGGSDLNAIRITSKFADQRRAYRRFKYRNGPEHDDFTDWITDYIKTEDDPYLKPVILLTNRRCYSSTEGFILSMKVLPHVTLVGGITGGGSGNPIERELPNGWSFRLSTWVVSEPDGTINEGIGIAPDVETNISEDDIANERDAILEKAIEILE